jgi:hypothetical protein
LNKCRSSESLLGPTSCCQSVAKGPASYLII